MPRGWRPIRLGRFGTYSSGRDEVDDARITEILHRREEGARHRLYVSDLVGNALHYSDPFDSHWRYSAHDPQRAPALRRRSSGRETCQGGMANVGTLAICGRPVGTPGGVPGPRAVLIANEHLYVVEKGSSSSSGS